jgi:antitoxin MazE
MDTRLTKWGNSLAVRIPRPAVEKAGLHEGDRLDLSVGEDGCVVLRPAKRKPTLSDLLAGITDQNRHAEADFGGPAGREAW